MLTLLQEPAAVTATTSRRLGDLEIALKHELRLIEDLRQALLAQRAGVADDDASQIETSVQAIGRTLLTLEEARRRRTTLVAALTGSVDTPLAALEASLGTTLPEGLQQAREAVRQAAERTALDVAINQHVLRRALEAGDAFLQQLFSSAADPMPVYAPGPRAEARSGALLLDRTA